MRVAVTGTPGTGKTTATDAVSTHLDVLHLNDVIKDEGLTTGRDDERDTLVADIDALADWLADRDDVLFESHLAHLFDADRVVVLRAHPETIESRLSERGEAPESIAENAESEALDVILAEAVERHSEATVYEIDTTDLTPEAVAEAIEAVVAGEREPSVGTVSFIDYL
jgi:adenylate kinase